MNMEKLKQIAEKLPKEYKANALALLTRMDEVIEGIGDEPIRWKPSILKLVQGTTDRSSLPKGAVIGDFVLGEKKLERPMKFIPMRIWEGRQMWSPDQNESKLLCSSLDAKVGYIGAHCNQCPHAKFDEVARKSECGKTHNVIAIFPDLSDIFVVGFSKTNFATGGALKTAAAKAGVPLYRRIYALDSSTSKKYKNVENYTLDLLSGDEREVPAALHEFLKELFDVITADRKETVERFHEYVLTKKDSNAALPPPVDETGESGNQTVTLSLEGGEAEAESPLAKNYQV